MPKIDPKSKLGLFVSHVMPGVVRPMRVLWNEVFGFIFCVLGVMFGGSAIRRYQAMQPGEAHPGNLLLLFILPTVMLYFGVTSFLRARRINRS
ncbi:MAG: hypothetical protein ABIR70_01510 [Bryobacteraceae bacterium]